MLHHLSLCRLRRNFNELVDRKWDKIASKFDIELTEVQKIFDYIQTLTPTPGAVMVLLTACMYSD